MKPTLKEKLRKQYAPEIEREFHKVWATDNGSANVENYIIDLLNRLLQKEAKKKKLISKLKE